jgi:hypothetical protein
MKFENLDHFLAIKLTPYYKRLVKKMYLEKYPKDKGLPQALLQEKLDSLEFVAKCALYSITEIRRKFISDYKNQTIVERFKKQNNYEGFISPRFSKEHIKTALSIEGEPTPIDDERNEAIQKLIAEDSKVWFKHVEMLDIDLRAALLDGLSNRNLSTETKAWFSDLYTDEKYKKLDKRAKINQLIAIRKAFKYYEGKREVIFVPMVSKLIEVMRNNVKKLDTTDPTFLQIRRHLKKFDNLAKNTR